MKKCFSPISRGAALLCGTIVAVAACSDPTGLRATEPTVETTLSVYALSGTPGGFPSAISLFRNRAVRTDASLSFDVAFDIDEQGNARLYPMVLIAWDRVQVHQVGLRRMTVPFASLTRAVIGGYTYTESLTGVVGDVFLIESNDQLACPFPFPPRIYAKILIEEIDLDARAVRLRMTLNPNCGFRSFLEGIPRD